MQSFLEFKEIIQKSQINYKSPLYARKVIRKISPFITWVLVKTPISANQVTLLQLLVGLTGLYLLSHKSTSLAFTGAALLHTAYVLDCVDGEVARYKSSQSLNGIFLDFVNHHIIIPFIYACLAFHYYFSTESIIYFGLGLVILICRINPVTKAHLDTIKYLVEKRKSPTYDIRNYQTSGEIECSRLSSKSQLRSVIIELLKKTRKMVSDCVEYPNDLIVISTLIIAELVIKSPILGFYFLVLFAMYSVGNVVLSLYLHLKHNAAERGFLEYAKAFSEIRGRTK